MSDTMELMTMASPSTALAVRGSAEGAATIDLSALLGGQEPQALRLVGRLDARCAADVRLALHAALASGAGDLVLHLGDAELADATAIGVLVETHHRARRVGRRLVLDELTPRSERLLRMVRLLPPLRETRALADRRDVSHPGGAGGIRATPVAAGVSALTA